MTKSGTNFEGMQSANRSLILRILSKKSYCTRADLARETGLTQASISKITADMIEAGIILEGKSVTGKRGRRSISISFNPEICKVIAVKLARKSFDVAVFQMGGTLVEQSHHPLGIEQKDPEEVMDCIKAQIQMFLDRYQDIQAIGVAVPGPFLAREGRIAIMSEFSGWDQINIYDELSQAFSLPIRMEHDANAAAFAEWSYSGKYSYGQETTLVSFLASEGIGAGVVTDGKLLLGTNGVAGEVGHMSINVDGPTCVCGNRGCLEMYCSALAFARRVTEDLRGYPESSLNHEAVITPEEVFHHMEYGDPFATEEVRRVGRYIGYGMANIIYLYDPQEIIMTDIMTGGGETLLKEVKRTVAERVLPELSRRVTIRMTDLKYDAILMGAAALASDLLLDDLDSLLGLRAAEP